MNLLTDEEIKEIQESGLAGGFGGSSKFARAIEAAILAKLASAELPEPVYEVYKYHGPYDSENGFDECDKATYEACKVEADRRAYYSADQLTAWGNTRYAQGAAAQLSDEPFAEIGYAAQTVGSEIKTPSIRLLKAIPPIDTKLYTRRQA